MTSEAKIIIAFLFNRSGKTVLKESELYLPLCMELGWLSTKEAQEFVKCAIKQGLLVKKDDAVIPNFSLENIKIPLGFTPSKTLFDEQAVEGGKENIIERIINRICSQTQKNQNDIQDEITKEREEKNLLPVVAAVYVARKHNVDIADLDKEVEQHIFQRK